MDEQQKAKLDQMNKLRRGAAIIEGTQDKFRQDGYTNLLNKYGTAQDNSTAYTYEQEPVVSDLELIRLYEGNGLFTKIIDRPSEEAVKHGFDIDYGDEDITEYVDKRLDDLDFEDKFATAEKWARLYGGSLIVMLCDDGGGLEEPLNWDKVTTIEELRVFERAVIQEDYTTMYNFHFFDTMHSDKPFGQPEYYHIYSMYGYFTVHYSRCLVFRNGRLPEQTTNSIYRYSTSRKSSQKMTSTCRKIHSPRQKCREHPRMTISICSSKVKRKMAQIMEEPQSLLSRTAKSYVQAAGHRKVSADREVISRTERHPRRQHSERHRRSLILFP